jgi:hypothetical protein
MKLLTAFQKTFKLKNRENVTAESRAFPRGGADGRIDRHDEANIRFSQFFEHA